MRIGVIGAGRMGQRRIADLLALGEEELLIWDPDSAALAHASATYDVSLAPRATDLWDWYPEAVLICTPPASHLDWLDRAYEAGVRAAFIEKPLALERPLGNCTVWDEMVTMVGCNWRFAQGPSAVKSWLKLGVIGEPRNAEFHAGYYLPDIRPDWKTCYVKETGACLDVGWHMVDLALDWFGTAKLDESHVWACRDIGWPDTDVQAAFYLKHDSGMQSLVTVDLLQAQPSHFGTVYGLMGKAGYSIEHHNAFWMDREGGGESVDLETDDRSMMRAELAHFLDCARDGKQTRNPIARARDTLALLLEAKARWQSK